MAITIITEPPVFSSSRVPAPEGAVSSTPAAAAAPEQNGGEEAAPAEDENGSAVLYYYSPLRVAMFSPANAVIAGFGAVGGDDAEEEGGQHERAGFDVYVSSRNLIFYFPTRSRGFTIPYSAMTMHAIQSRPSRGLYLQLETIPFTTPSTANESTGDDDEQTDNVLEVVVAAVEGENAEDDLSALFTALSECSALNPDSDGSSAEDGDGEDDGEAVRVLGSTADIFGSGHQWITAENVDEFADIAVAGEERLVVPENGLQESSNGRFDDAEEEEEEEGEEGDGPVVKYRRLE